MKSQSPSRLGLTDGSDKHTGLSPSRPVFLSRLKTSTDVIYTGNPGDMSPPLLKNIISQICAEIYKLTDESTQNMTRYSATLCYKYLLSPHIIPFIKMHTNHITDHFLKNVILI